MDLLVVHEAGTVFHPGVFVVACSDRKGYKDILCKLLSTGVKQVYRLDKINLDIPWVIVLHNNVASIPATTYTTFGGNSLGRASENSNSKAKFSHFSHNLLA